MVVPGQQMALRARRTVVAVQRAALSKSEADLAMSRALLKLEWQRVVIF
jgi:hypothetical protein